MKPKMVKIPIELLVNANARNAPIKASGKENITTSGYIKLSYKATMIRYTRIMDANKAIPKVPKPSAWFSWSPAHV
ncbi:hypothetical protein D3C86_1914420 [compost metagenome]